MKIAIVGSRHFPAQDVVRRFVESLPPQTVIVSGGAVGVDSWSIEIGASLGLATEVIAADWERLGRKAGPVRNAELVRNAEEVVAFWDGRSRGTLNTVVLAHRAGVPVRVFDTQGVLLSLGDVLHCAEERGVIAAINHAAG